MGNPSKLLKKLRNKDVTNILADAQLELSGGGHGDLAKKVLRALLELFGSSENSSEKPALDDDLLLKVACICCLSITDDFQHSTNVCSDYQLVVILYNILFHFVRNGALMCCVSFTDFYLPIIEKMLPAMSEADLKVTQNLSSLYYNLLVSLKDDVLMKDPLSSDKLSCLSLWRLLLRVSSLVQIDLILPINLLRVMLSKYASKHASTNCEKVANFSEVLLSSFESFCKGFSKRYHVTDLNIGKLYSNFIALEKSLLKSFMKVGNTKAAGCTMSSLTACVRELFQSYPNYIRYWEIAMKTFDCFVFCLKRPPVVKKIASEIELCLNSLQSCLKEEKSMELDLIAGLCGTIIEWGLVHPKDDAKHFFDSTIISAVYKYSELLVKLILSSSSMSCCPRNGKQCPVQKDLLGAFDAAHVPVQLILHKLMDGNKDEQLLNLLQNAVQRKEQILQKALNQGCIQTDYMSSVFYERLYYLGYFLYKSNSWENAKKCLLKALAYFLKVWESDDTQSKAFPKVYIFNMLVVCFENLKLYKEARAAILSPILLHKNVKYTPDHVLTKTWASLQDKDHKNAKTSIEFLNQYFSVVQSLCPSVCGSGIQKSCILLWELKCYASHTISHPEIIIKAWEDLKETVSSQVLEEQIIFIDGAVSVLGALLGVCSVSSKLLQSFAELNFEGILEMPLSNRQRVKVCCLLALLNQRQALGLALKNAEENAIRVKNRPKFAAKGLERVTKPEDVPDPNDTCDVMVADKSLTVKKEKQIIDLLDASLETWNKATSNEVPVSFFEDFVDDIAVSLVQTASTFALFGHHRSAAKAWEICLDFAKKINKDDLILQALSGLMNTVECKQTWVIEAEALSLKVQDHPRYRYLTLFYHTSRAFNALRTNNYEEGIAILSKIPKCAPSESSLWCFVYAKLLRASYAILPGTCVFPEQLSYLDPVLEAQSGLKYALEEFKKKEKFMFPIHFAALVDQLLSISLWLGRLYRQIKLPRQARAFLKSELQIAEKLGLATRTAEFLCELAQVDLVCEMSNEAELKIDEVKFILWEGSATTSNTKKLKVNHLNFPSVEKNWKHKPIPENVTSPNLKKTTSISLCDDHPSFCDCYWCRNITIQLISLWICQIQAKIFSLDCNVLEAHALYKRGLKQSRAIVDAHKKDRKIPGILLFLHFIQCTHAALKMDYADLLILYEKDREARLQNDGAFTLIQGLKTAERYLYAEACEQKMCFLVLAEDKKQSTGQGMLLVEQSSSDQLTPEKANIKVDVKTPENRVRLKTPRAVGKRKALLTITTPNQIFTSPPVDSNVKSIPQNDKVPHHSAVKENVSSSTPIKSRNLRSSRKKSEKIT